MEYIGKQISVLSNEDEVSIVILPISSKVKNILMLIWLLAWTACGGTVIYYLFHLHNHNQQAVLIVWMGFWIYFEFLVLKALRWRMNGMERIKIRKGMLTIQRIKGRKNKLKEYELDAIKEIKLVKNNDKNFFKFMENSYWTVGAEKIEFEYAGKSVRFGIQLSQQDANQLLKKVRFAAKRMR